MDKNIMTPREFRDKLLEIQNGKHRDDEEAIHINMDNLLSELLISLGYKEGIQIFKEQTKWYA